jgi:hypothetical protein
MRPLPFVTLSLNANQVTLQGNLAILDTTH